MIKIYTKTGDKGTTSLFGGTRVLKSSVRVETYGTVDELNSTIGIVLTQIQSSKVKTELKKIQYDLLTIGSTLANPSASKISGLPQRVEEFERLIDQLTSKLPELRNFILPGGGMVGSHLHLARTICRRAERRLVELSQHESVDNAIMMYFNRLSDLLFTMARFVNHQEKKKETIWKRT